MQLDALISQNFKNRPAIRYSSRAKIAVIAFVRRYEIAGFDGISPASKKFSVSVRTIKRWMDQARKSGLTN
jgi:hypothetical protein